MQLLPEYDFSSEEAGRLFRFQKMEQRGPYVPDHPHRHRYHEIFLFLKAEGNHMIDFSDYPLSDKKIHFVFPGQVHQLNRSADSSGLVLCFSSALLYDPGEMHLLFPFRFNPAPAFSDEAADEIFSWGSLLAKSENQDAATAAHLLGILFRKCNALLPAAQTRSDHMPGTLLSFLSLLESDFRTTKSVSVFADRLAVSPEKLNEDCRKFLGKTAGDVIRQRVHLEACRLLLHARSSVKEIAFQVGYDDPAYFNRVFQKESGMSPLQFRDSVRKKYNPNPDLSSD